MQAPSAKPEERLPQFVFRTKIFRPIFSENHVMKIYLGEEVEFYTNLAPDYKQASGKFHAPATLIQHKYHLHSLDKV